MPFSFLHTGMNRPRKTSVTATWSFICKHSVASHQQIGVRLRGRVVTETLIESFNLVSNYRLPTRSRLCALELPRRIRLNWNLWPIRWIWSRSSDVDVNFILICLPAEGLNSAISRGKRVSLLRIKCRKRRGFLVLKWGGKGLVLTPLLGGLEDVFLFYPNTF